MISAPTFCSTSLPGHRPSTWGFLEKIAAGRGLAAVGVTRAAPLPDHALQIYDRWLEHNHHASMGYMVDGREERRDPSRIGHLDSASVVIMTALPYGEGAHDDKIWESVARYARGRDYHDTMEDHLRAIIQVAQEHHRIADYKICVDGAPLSERTLAVLAGLGSIGKNGHLLVPGVGPRVVLGGLVIEGPELSDDAGPAPISKVHDPCGDCRLCLDSCPTRALNGDGTLDARRCLAFHTVENRDLELPPAISAQVTGLFGCDLCTVACPRHNSSQPGQLEDSPARLGRCATLEGLVGASNRVVTRAFQGTALARTGGRTLKRNAVDALRNQGDSAIRIKENDK